MWLRNKVAEVLGGIRKIDKVNKKLSSLDQKINMLLAPSKDPSSLPHLVAKLLVELNNQKDTKRLEEVEFKVYSQWGDDGIIQYLIEKLDIKHKTFVEFGVENYTESNTRFLLTNNNWSGLIMDGSESNIRFAKNDKISWAHDLYARQAFITKENINSLLSDLPFGQHLGILSIDIDGNDYWVWEAIETVEADIVIIEYNSCFGGEKAWSIPYKEDFVRSREANEISYFGASLGALHSLGQKKGYDFIGCNSAGNNAYFVRSDINNFFQPLEVKEGFVESKFAEGLGSDGERIRGKERIKGLKGLPIVNLKTNKIETIE